MDCTCIFDSVHSLCERWLLVSLQAPRGPSYVGCPDTAEHAVQVQHHDRDHWNCSTAGRGHGDHLVLVFIRTGRLCSPRLLIRLFANKFSLFINLHLERHPNCVFHLDLVSTGCKEQQVSKHLNNILLCETQETNLPAAPTEQAALEERKIVTLPIGLEDFPSVGHYQSG